jgi:hypothetical protein
MTFNTNRVSRHRSNCRTTVTLPGSNVELRSMPGAGNDGSREASFCQGAGAVGATMVGGVKLTFNIKQSYFAPFGPYPHTAPGTQLVGLRYFNVLTHFR